MDDREAQRVVIALIAVAIGAVCEVYDWLRDENEEQEEQTEVLRVNSEVVVLEAPEE
jgi:hypothetical protein